MSTNMAAHFDSRRKIGAAVERLPREGVSKTLHRPVSRQWIPRSYDWKQTLCRSDSTLSAGRYSRSTLMADVVTLTDAALPSLSNDS